VGADADTAELLRVTAGTPVLLLEGTSTDEAARPVEVFRTWHRADRVVFDINVIQEPRTSTGSLRERLDALGREMLDLARELESAEGR
jgi:GntR family transcriptional regulator